MCVTSLKLNSERARDIDFSLPFLETGIAIIVKIRSGVLSPTAFLGWLQVVTLRAVLALQMDLDFLQKAEVLAVSMKTFNINETMGYHLLIEKSLIKKS